MFQSPRCPLSDEIAAGTKLKRCDDCTPADFIKSGGFDKEEIAQMREDIQFWASKLTAAELEFGRLEEVGANHTIR